MSTYDFSTLYTSLPHHLMKDKLIDSINRTFIDDALVYLLNNIFITFGTKLYRQTIGIPTGTNCAPLVAELFLFCYERDFMKSL